MDAVEQSWPIAWGVSMLGRLVDWFGCDLRQVSL